MFHDVQVAETDLDEIQRVGRFNPDRMPAVSIRTFDKVHNIRAAVSPDCSYELVSSIMKAAKTEILLYIYNVSADYMVTLLKDARDRGVAIKLMYDLWDTNGDEVNKLESLGVDLKVAPSKPPRDVFSVCHQKFAVIDSKTVLVESANWATTSIPFSVDGGFKRGNREWLVSLDNKDLAGWFTELFMADWHIPEMQQPASAAMLQTPPPEEIDVLFAAANRPSKTFPLQHFLLAGDGAKVTPIISPINYFDLAEQLILNARSSVYIQQQYAVAKGPATDGLFKALQKRKDEIEIRLMVSPAFRVKNGKDKWEESYDSAKKYEIEDRLRALNLKFYTHLHNKGIIVDRETVVVSSTNWSENSIAKAREAGVVIEHPDVAEYFATVFDFDWENGIDAADVPAFLASFFNPETATEKETIHPADLA